MFQKHRQEKKLFLTSSQALFLYELDIDGHAHWPSYLHAKGKI